MGPKIEAARRFAASGGFAGIGALRDATQILAGQAGTRVLGEAPLPCGPTGRSDAGRGSAAKSPAA